MPTVWLGNRSAISVDYPEDGEGRQLAPVVTRHPKAKRCTWVDIPEVDTFAEAFTNITHAKGVWAHHGEEPPAWVASDWPQLAVALSAHFGCELREPETEV